MTFTQDEKNIIAVYESGSRGATILALRDMKAYLEPDEKELRSLVKRASSKLRRMSNDDYDQMLASEDFWDGVFFRACDYERGDD